MSANFKTNIVAKGTNISFFHGQYVLTNPNLEIKRIKGERVLVGKWTKSIPRGESFFDQMHRNIMEKIKFITPFKPGSTKAEKIEHCLCEAKKHINTGRGDLAIFELEQAIELDPKNAEAHYLSGSIYHARAGKTTRKKERLKDVFCAEKEYREAITKDPNFAEAYYFLGMLLWRYFKKFDEAKEMFEKACQIDPNNTFAKVYLEKIESWGEYQKLLHAVPFVYDYLEELPPQMVSEIFKDCENMCKREIAKDPVEYYNYETLAGLYLHQERIEETKEVYQEAIDKISNRDEAYWALGYLYEGQELFSQAEKMYRAAFKIRPDYAEYADSIGYMCQKQGRTEEAEKMFKKAMELNPRVPEPYYRLGILYKECGNIEEAEKMLQRSIFIFKALKSDVRAHREFTISDIWELLRELKGV